MNVSATDFQNNVSKYIDASAHGDITITKRGKPVAILTSPSNIKPKMAKSLLGVLPEGIDVEQEIRNRKERI